MQLYDKDLLSVQEVRTLVERARRTERAGFENQRRWMKLSDSIAEAGVEMPAGLRKWRVKRPLWNL
ncbi:MAG: hypothetical protein ACLVAW_22505 [Eisenbergiella massiliensis]